jgi:penicillin-binding protein 1C
MLNRFLNVPTPRGKKILRHSLFAGGGMLCILGLLHLAFPLPDKIAYSTMVTDRNGELLHAYLTPDEKWRMKVELNEISPLLRKTIIHKEDKHFYRHIGVNPVAVVRALFSNLSTGRRMSGASTITMQVARALEPKPRTMGNKIREMFRALQLEWTYSKDEILQLYLNLVPYGGNIEGVKTASILYFGKDPDHLSLAEITALSIIPNRPGSLVMGRIMKRSSRSVTNGCIDSQQKNYSRRKRSPTPWRNRLQRVAATYPGRRRTCPRSFVAPAVR